MPIYEFECRQCQDRFEELVASGTETATCPACGSEQSERLLSPVSPPGRMPRGPGVKSNESMRVEREAARRERIGEAQRKRAAGEP